MGEQDRVAVIGAGIIGCAVAFGLAREGWRVLLADAEEPGVGGASFGNVGHIATELIEPLPSPALLFGFWRELFALGGPLDIPWHRLPEVTLWSRRFAAAAFRRRANTRYLAPLVRPASAAWERLLREAGTPGLLRRNGHDQFWFGAPAGRRARAEAYKMTKLGIATAPVAAQLLRAVASAAGSQTIAGLKFPDSSHVLDPRAVCEVLARAAVERGTTLHRARVRSLALRADQLHGPQHPGDAHGLAAASVELHGVFRPRGGAGPEKARAVTGKPQAPRVPLRGRALKLGRAASHPSGLPAGDRSGARCGEALLRHRPPAPGIDPGTGHGRSGGRPGLGPRGRPRPDSL